MGFTILHVNIRNFRKNKYSFNITTNDYNPDIILLNETGQVDSSFLKIRGYKGFGTKNNINDGMAIFYKYNLSIEHVTFTDEDLIAIKIITNMGPILIATSYCPPRIKSLPIIAINKLFNQPLPILFIGDLNAKHYILNNTNSSHPNIKGKQLCNIVNHYDLQVLGPSFNTYITAHNKGKPDIILSNKKFTILFKVMTLVRTIFR